MMRELRDQTGVAMVTVLLVAAALTVVSSTAAFLTIKEFGAGADDRRGTEALAYAESGVDRLMLELRQPYSWNRINEAGCEFEPVFVPLGDLGEERSYTAHLTAFDPNLPAEQRLPDLRTWPETPWDASWNDATPLCATREGTPASRGHWFALTSRGQHPTASRVVRQVVKIRATELPIGLYADSVNVQGGNPSTLDISLVTAGDVQGREKLTFSGYDPYYKLGHFWEGQSMDVPAPAGVHATGTIYCVKQKCGDDGVEHPESLNCTANVNGQSQWDQSGGGTSLTGVPKCTQWAGTPAEPPPYSSFSNEDLRRAAPTPELTDQDYADLKAAAKASGMYCKMNDSGTGSCTTPTTTFTTNGLFQTVPGVGRNFIAYFDYPPGGDPFATARTITWKAGIGPCSDDPSVHRFAAVVVRYGSLDLSGKDELVGAFLVREGRAWLRGEGGVVKIHGTVIAKEIDFGGNAQALLTDCWVRNMPTSFLQVTPQSWSEVDR